MSSIINKIIIPDTNPNSIETKPSAHSIVFVFVFELVFVFVFVFAFVLVFVFVFELVFVNRFCFSLVGANRDIGPAWSGAGTPVVVFALTIQ